MTSLSSSRMLCVQAPTAEIRRKMKKIRYFSTATIRVGYTRSSSSVPNFRSALQKHYLFALLTGNLILPGYTQHLGDRLSQMLRLYPSR